MYYVIHVTNVTTAECFMLVPDVVNVALHAAHTFAAIAKYWGIINLIGHTFSDEKKKPNYYRRTIKKISYLVICRI